jgi:hypothetical protein
LGKREVGRMSRSPITDREMSEMHPNGLHTDEYTLEELKEEMEHRLGFLETFVEGKSHYWNDYDDKREMMLIVAQAWAESVLHERRRAQDNWNFAMSLIRCHLPEQKGVTACLVEGRGNSQDGE